LQNAPASRRHRIVGLCVVLLGCLFFSIRGYQEQIVAGQSRDFKPVYAAARCLIDNCDPYDSAQTAQEFLRHGGDTSDPMPFLPYYVGYTPPALSLAVPFAIFPFGPAHILWLSIGIALFCCAALCAADLCVGPYALIVQCLLAVFIAMSTELVMLAQPAMPAIGLLVIAVWCFYRHRFTAVGILAFAVSLILKPHIGALIWVFLLCFPSEGSGPASKFRLRALQVAFATLLLSTPGLLLAAHNPAAATWPHKLQRNLDGLSAPGALSDPGPANYGARDITSLQTLFSLVRDKPAFYNKASIAVFTLLFLAWLYLLRRPRQSLPPDAQSSASSARFAVALATITTLSFLPIYHRQYDTRLLLLIFPAVAILASTYPRTGRLALALTAFATIALSHQFVRLTELLGARIAKLPPWLQLLLHRPLVLTLLLLSAFFLYAMSLSPPQERRSTIAPA
jgi:hypothetical protein